MQAEQNKAFVRRYITEILNKKDVGGLLQCFTINHYGLKAHSLED